MTPQTGTSQHVVYRNRLPDWADKYLFIVLFLVGTALIVVLKRLGVRQIVVMTAPITTMLVYGGFVLFSKRYRIRDDRAGDSLYYLGFLFTMVSLAYSLYEFGTTEGGTRSIVTNFGIALATTILGLTLRVIYHQMRQDPFDVEREVHFELTQAADKLRGELHEAIINFGSLRLAVLQSLTEAKTDSKASVEAMTKEVIAQCKTSTTELSTAVGNSAAAVRKHTTEMVEALEAYKTNHATGAGELKDATVAVINTLNQQTKTLQESGDEVAGAFEGLVDRVQKIDVPPDLLSAKVQSIVTQLDAAVQSALKDIGTEQDRIGNLGKLIEQFAKVTGQLTTDTKVLQQEAVSQRNAVTVVVGDLKRTVESVSSIASDAVNVAKTNVRGHRDLLQSLEKESAATLATVQDHRERLASDVRTSSELLSQLHNSLVELTRTIIQRLDGRKS